MSRFDGLGPWCGYMVRRARLLSFVAGIILGWSGAVAAAQVATAQDAAVRDEPIHTLHVYTNLMQIPVLVLSPSRTPIAPIAPNRFSVSIDSGPKFRASHVRPEGSDPISLAILLDASGGEDQLLPEIDKAIASLAPLSLQPQDHVSVYALDCSLTQTLKDAPATAEGLKLAVDSALATWTYRKKNRHVPRCQQSIHLWDVLTLVVRDLYLLPGRRVILAVTDGKDKGSKTTWNEARAFAQGAGVAVFGLTYSDVYLRLYQGPMYEDALNSVCELSGGIAVTTNERFAEQTLKSFVSMVRGRYIVEFPRPSNSTVGRHDFVVTIQKSDAFIRPAGISVPIPDTALMADPTTVPSDPSRTPVEGTRGVLTKPR
jgi:hypothetical protein